ncbi:NADH dehydrogenase [ubiquinone] 1 subunit C2-like [Macrosteles quadrilineatus]|uniref:NADH dehydrogenase [ubiquinone] 1 subunit C2-like n=1 Tax=Macrosteles quadrilineatus TaxID=74068 RepID=UPI0023E2FAE6|nr:NADH dehydrogenase [ubiquinone] 1 subunit C2-like [Macrosteles quadrilineatus]XP_054264410.1 NADH dehydrogenase [ubiquinone] 1 subunit C2-like [Macrosteles quadrilineatus]
MSSKPAVVQSAPDDPKFLLDPENIPEPTFLQDKYLPVTLALAGFTSAVYRNYTRRRPLYAGAQVTLAVTLIGGGIGWWIQTYRTAYWADRDAILRHYVQLHPEDFPAKERVVVGDLFKPWIPNR